jgi:hypothetical protein
MYNKRKEEADMDGYPPARLSVTESMELIVTLADLNPATIIIDALDECDPNRRQELLQALDEIIQKSANLIKVFVSSRDDIDIVLRLKHSPNVFIQASDNKEDIENFVHAEVEHSINNHKLLRGQVPSQLKIQIISALIEGAQGM